MERVAPKSPYENYGKIFFKIDIEASLFCPTVLSRRIEEMLLETRRSSFLLITHGYSFRLFIHRTISSSLEDILLLMQGWRKYALKFD